jgi:hypothetical protein
MTAFVSNSSHLFSSDAHYGVQDENIRFVSKPALPIGAHRGGSMNHRNLRILAMSGILILGVPVLSSCGQSVESIAEKAIEAGTDADVDISDGGVTVKSTDGTTTSIGEGVDLPSNWPSDVPVVDGTLVTVSVSGTEGEATAMWKVDGDVTTVANAYKSELKSAGYTIVNETTIAMAILIGAEGNGKNVSASVTDTDGQTVVTITSAPTS